MANDWEDFIEFPCVEAIQPIGTFYLGVIDSNDLIKISFADIRRVEERDVEKYLGMQRPLSPRRVAELKEYVKNVDATFPTSVILAIRGDDASYDPKSKKMKVNKEEGVAKIIDGQHRLAGLEGYSEEVPFQINVTVFIDMDIEDQAMVFATINLAQTKVNRSLVYDLYELTSSRSPQKTSHNIALLYDEKEGSPFQGRIKRLGRATERNQILTQAQIVDAFLGYISGDSLKAMRDRDVILRGGKLTTITEDESRKLIFRNMFIDEKDDDIAEVVWNYFLAVKSRWTEAWMNPDSRGNVLPRTNGFRAFMRFFKHAYLHLGGLQKLISKNEFLDLLVPIELENKDFSTRRFPPGTSGETKLYRELLKLSALE